MTIQEKARELQALFVRKSRGEEIIIILRDGAPQWATDLVQKAHGEMFPDDYIYSFCEDAADRFSETENLEEVIDELEADVYTHALLTWLSSNLNRVGFVDQVIEEFGLPQEMGFVGILMRAQIVEKEQVFQSVLNSLRNLVEGE